jgi:hypothetical protein
MMKKSSDETIQLHDGRMPQEQEMVKRAPGKAPGIMKIESTDRAIDKLVYELSPDGDNNMG